MLFYPYFYIYSVKSRNYIKKRETLELIFKKSINLLKIKFSLLVFFYIFSKTYKVILLKKKTIFTLFSQTKYLKNKNNINNKLAFII